MKSSRVKELAALCGFQLAGITPAVPVEPDADHFLDWVARGLAGRMTYLTDRRAEIRTDPRKLLPSAKSLICVGRLYNNPGAGPIARYARSEDYHDFMRRDLEKLNDSLRAEAADFESRIYIDTAPLLERSYARLAGLGWIGKNTCLINQEIGSYVFLGEILTSLEFEYDGPAPERCGTCTRCIDACPTNAIVPGGQSTELNATRCISYLTIELKGDIPESQRGDISNFAFGCDICQEVCPWNRRAPFATEYAQDSLHKLEELARLTPDDFREAFRRTPVWRTKYRGLLRNVAIAMGNSGDVMYRPSLEALALSDDEVIRTHAEWALARLDREDS